MWIIGLLAVYGLIAGVRNISRHSGNAYGQSKDAAVKSAAKKAGPGGLSPGHRKAVTRAHRSAYWGREIGQGFPVMRTGWNTGWLAHKTAMAHRKAIGEEALTSNLETEAGRLAALKEHHRRQQIARDEITLICGPAATREEVQKAADNVRYLPRRTESGEVPPLPADGIEPRKKEASADALDVTDVPGIPDRPDASRPAEDGPEKAPMPDAHLTTTDSTSANPTGGMMATAEITYNQTLEQADAIIRDCEQELARIRARKTAAQLEQLTSVGLDAATLSRASDIDDALKAQEKAAQQALDSAQAFKTGLVHDHGNLNEAHQSAPVEAADKEFYRG